MKKSAVVSLAALLAASAAIAGPPSGVPAGGGGRPDFAGSGGRPDFAGSAGASHSASAGGAGQSTAESASGGRSSTRGNSSNAGSFPSNANAGGQGLSHAAPQAQGTLQALDTAFSEGEISLIREYFTTRTHENKPDSDATSTPSSTSTFKKGQKLSASYMAEPLPADLLAKLPNRPGLTYLRVGDTILMLAGPDDVIVDIIDASSLGGGG
jgi:hypothetical protein